MCVGARLETFSGGSFRPLHLFGNKLVRFLVNWMAGTRLTDIMSGYRAFSRHVADRVPLSSAGFEVETEFTVQTLFHRLRIVEVQVPYREGIDGSVSKLHTYRDGFRVLWTIFTLFRSFKPLTFFGTVGLLLFAAGLAAGVPQVMDCAEHRYVFRVPLALLAIGLMLLATGSTALPQPPLAPALGVVAAVRHEQPFLAGEHGAGARGLLAGYRLPGGRGRGVLFPARRRPGQRGGTGVLRSCGGPGGIAPGTR